MVEYITKAELRNFANQLPDSERTQLRKLAESRSPMNSTFLSHSSKDDDLVVGATRVLTNHGASVYIDKVDPSMPPYTTKETAEKLKTRIRQASKFVLLASENSKESKWVPWELGVADGNKGLGNIALFPAAETSTDTAWTKWEYMGLYNRIVWGSIETSEPAWIVLDYQANTASFLRKWLAA